GHLEARRVPHPVRLVERVLDEHAVQLAVEGVLVPEAHVPEHGAAACAGEQHVAGWQGATPIPGVTFEICVSGPSFPTPFCQKTDGDTLTFGPLFPGSYVVSSTVVEHWEVTISDLPVSVQPLQIAEVTVHSDFVQYDVQNHLYLPFIASHRTG
ncbi:MAG: hypothetical protein R6W76_06965, partial [Caldilinea sp.]